MPKKGGDNKSHQRHQSLAERGRNTQNIVQWISTTRLIQKGSPTLESRQQSLQFNLPNLYQLQSEPFLVLDRPKRPTRQPIRFPFLLSSL